jgi:hypothetical protein
MAPPLREGDKESRYLPPVAARIEAHMDEVEHDVRKRPVEIVEGIE